MKNYKIALMGLALVLTFMALIREQWLTAVYWGMVWLYWAMGACEDADAEDNLSEGDKWSIENAPTDIAVSAEQEAEDHENVTTIV